MTTRETVAVLGAGSTMGRPMARNLALAGFDVRAWNRSAEKAAPLADDGVELCETRAEAARLIEDAAARQGLELPLLRTIRERLDEAAPEHGDKDLAATFLSTVR